MRDETIETVPEVIDAHAPLAVTQAPSSTAITPADARNSAVAALTAHALAQAGTLKLTPEESKALSADFADDCFQPGAGGKEHLIYIEHAALRDRLNTVLGLGQWVPVVRESWNEDFVTEKGKPGKRVYARVMLVVRGAYVGEAVGDMDYYPHNAGQNYGDAFEGAKTAALRRCCKEFGIGLQAWRKDWCSEWWVRRRGQKFPPCRATSVDTGKTAQNPSQGNSERSGGTVRTLAERVRTLRERLGVKAGAATAFLRNFTADGSDANSALLPSEDLESLSETQMNIIGSDFKGFLARLDEFIVSEGKPEHDLGPVQPDAADLAADELPMAIGEALPDSRPRVTGTLIMVKPKSGKSAKTGKPWTSYGIGVDVGEEKGFWANTFSKSLADAATALKGQQVTLVYEENAKGFYNAQELIDGNGQVYKGNDE